MRHRRELLLIALLAASCNGIGESGAGEVSMYATVLEYLDTVLPLRGPLQVHPSRFTEPMYPGPIAWEVPELYSSARGEAIRQAAYVHGASICELNAEGHCPLPNGQAVVFFGETDWADADPRVWVSVLERDDPTYAVRTFRATVVRMRGRWVVRSWELMFVEN